MDDVHAHSAADCNGVSGGCWGQRTSQTDAFTHRTHTYPSVPPVLTYKHECIVGVLVRTQTSADCGIHLHTVMYMWNTYKLKIHRHVDANIHKHMF